MIVAHIALLTLIGFTPVLFFLDSLLVSGLLDFYIAAVLFLVVLSIRQGEAGHLVQTTRWALWLAALPAIWMSIQLLPLPLGALSRSLWQSAATALNTPLWPSTTMDPGLTLLALCRYLALIGVGVITAAVTVDRQNAEKIFLALSAVTLLLAVLVLASRLAGIDLGIVQSAGVAGAALGIVFFSCALIMIVERHVAGPHPQRIVQLLMPIAGVIVSATLCVVAVVMVGSLQALFAVICGIAVVAIIYFVRRIGLGGRAALTMAALGVVAAGVVVSTKATPGSTDLSVRYSDAASADQLSTTDRMIGEVGLAGSGAGTFALLHRFYAAQEATTAIDAPTFAAQLAVELGPPALWVIVGTAVVLIFLCARGGFNRGRDFFYSLAGAGVLVTSLILSFCQIGVENLAISILLAATTGLALVQSVSRML